MHKWISDPDVFEALPNFRREWLQRVCNKLPSLLSEVIAFKAQQWLCETDKQDPIVLVLAIHAYIKLFTNNPKL